LRQIDNADREHDLVERPAWHITTTLPEFRHLHGDPRFTDLIHRIGLPASRDMHLKQAGS